MQAGFVVRLRLAALIAGVFLIGANSFVLSPILGDVAVSLHTGPVAVTRAISAFGAAAAFSAFFLSGLIDRYGTRLVLVFATMAMVVSFAGSAFSRNWQTLVLFQAIAGFSTGVLLPAIYAEAVRIAPEGQGARTLGTVLAGWSIAMVAGVPISAILSDFLSWRIAYMVLAVLAILLVLAFSLFRNDRPLARPVLASRGSVLRVPYVKSLLFTCFFFMTAFYGTYALLGHHIREVQGINASLASTAVISYGLGFGFGGMVARYVDRLGPGKVFPFLLTGSMLLYLSLIAATATLWMTLIAVFLLGFTNHFGLNLLVLRLAGRSPEARGTLIGLNTTATYLAVFFGPLLMSAIYERLSFTAVCLCAGVLLFVCAARMWNMRNM